MSDHFGTPGTVSNRGVKHGNKKNPKKTTYTFGMQGGAKKMVVYTVTEHCFGSHFASAWQRNVTVNGKEIPSLKMKH